MRVLVVDADARASFAIGRMLEGAKARVDRPVAPSQTVRLAQQNRYDLLLLDLDRFPNLIREVRSVCDDCPILALSAAKAGQGLERAFELGADGYLPKPFGCRELLDSIRSCRQRGSPGSQHHRRRASAPVEPMPSDPIYCKIVEK